MNAGATGLTLKFSPRMQGRSDIGFNPLPDDLILSPYAGTTPCAKMVVNMRTTLLLTIRPHLRCSDDGWKLEHC